MIDFTQTKAIRREILQKNSDKDSLYIPDTNNILISVPHGVVQTRLGKQKVAEIGTIPTGWIIANATNCHLLIKTKNNFDDANFDEHCEYRKRLANLIE